MKKSEREIVFNKFGGRCAYCGDELQKGWHVDELLPVRRNRKYIVAGWWHIAENRPKHSHERASNNPEFEWRDGRWKADGVMHPERFHINNQNPSCASCNINKHSGSLEDFRELIQGFMKHLNGVNTQYKIAKRYGLVKEEIKPVVFYFETLTTTPKG